MRITVQVRPSLDTRELREFARRHRATLSSAGVPHFYLIDIENPETGELVLSLLRQKTGVVAAYVKPSEDLP
jgi:hypothetical protein